MKSLPQWSATVLLAAPLGAWALGLGDIDLRSGLNQPFQAEIELLSVTQEELDGLRVTLASRDTFERYGLDRPAHLGGLTFDVERRPDGRYVVQVRSRQPIEDPFVTMLIEATWPRGRLLREYTVLLDPPIFTPEIGVEQPIRQAAAGAPSSSSSGAIDRPPAPGAAAQPVSRPAAPSAPAQPTDRVVDGRYGPVQSAETLWSIANQLRPSDVTVNQMMVALYEANPAAFDGNMNVLLRGATLTVPDRSTLVGRSSAEATALVSRQESAWRAGRGEAVAAAPSAGGASSAADASTAETQQGRLRLVPPSADSILGSDSDAASAGAAAGADGAGAAQVARLETEVAALRSELEESRRLLELRNAELQALQTRVAAGDLELTGAPDTAALPATAAGVDLESEQLFVDEPISAPPTAGEDTPDLPASVTSAEEAAAATAEADALSEAVTQEEPSAASDLTPAAAPVTAQPRAAVPEPSLLARLFSALSSPFLLIGLGLGAVLLTAVWYLRQRREDIEDVTGRWDALEAELEEAHAEPTGQFRALDEQAFAADDAAPAVAAALSEPGTPAAEQPVAHDNDDSMSTHTVVNLDQGDVLAEADFHMAYGLYDQAAELVQKALETEPHRRDLKLKLLEVFFVWGNKDAFRDAAGDLKAEIGDGPDGDWDKVLIMGKQLCPDDTLFAAAAGAAGAVDVSLEPTGSTALDFPLEEKVDEGASAVDGLDFELAATGERIGSDFESDSGEDALFSSSSEDDMLAIGASTAAGLEAALFGDSEDGEDGATQALQGGGDRDDGGDDVTSPDLTDAFAAFESETDINLEELGTTQETPTVESEASEFDSDWAAALGLDDTGPALTLDADDPASSSATAETPTVEAAGPEAPTVETPTIETPWAADHTSATEADWADSDATMESPWADPDALTMETPGADGEVPSSASTPWVDSDAPTMETAWADPDAPTMETPQADPEELVAEATLWADPEAPTMETPWADPDAPTMETPWADPEAPTMETPRPDSDEMLAMQSGLSQADEPPTDESSWSDAHDPALDPVGAEAPTVETPTLTLGEETGASAPDWRDSSGETTALPSVEGTSSPAPSDFTEEIDLDDLGLTVEDLSGLPDDLGNLSDADLSDADLGDGDTREQPKLDDETLLAATGVTEVTEDEAIEHIGTAVLGDPEATMLAPMHDRPGSHPDLGMKAEGRDEDEESLGGTSLLRALESDPEAPAGADGGLDLDLDGLSAALSGGDTVEQPRSSIESDLFEDGGATPLDLDVGFETIGSDDPTGTEDLGALDPHTMTEIGTKLDLARAYIDMGDPEGARSILEEVLDEGDAGQRREAQGLIDALVS